jgi:hypothetical protein
VKTRRGRKTGLSEQPAHDFVYPDPHGWLGNGGSQQASDSAFGDVPERSPCLSDNDRIGLVSELSFQCCNLCFGFLPLPGVDLEFTKGEVNSVRRRLKV